jgi:pimeloyl-ACP methyl ester carboxylesterase
MLTLVLLPGMDGTGRLFERFIRALGTETKVQVVAYPPDKPLHYSKLQSFVQNALPANEPFVLLAESFSGPIAIEFAANAGAQLRGLVLCCTFARNPRAYLGWTKALLGLVPFDSIPAFAISRLLLGQFETPQLRAEIAHAVAQVSPQVMRTRMRAVLEVNVSAQLSRIKVPCVYLRATADRLVPANEGAYLRSLLPAIQICEISGPHCLLQASPGESALAVKAFLGNLHTATR